MKNVPNSHRRVELGCPGHFIAVESCHYRRHTQVGSYRVSTIGDYYQVDLDDPQRQRTKRTTVGAGKDAFYETMVFKTTRKPAKGNGGCGCREVKDWGGLECIRAATAKEAHKVHERMVVKYGRAK